jgi:hypothetical protein
MAAYTAGQCNIGKAESNSRRFSGYLWSAAYILSLIALAVLSMPRISRIITILPLFLAILSFWQARQKFCVMYAVGGVYNMVDDQVGDTVKISEQKYRRADQLRALRMGLSAFAIAAIATTILYLV